MSEDKSTRKNRKLQVIDLTSETFEFNSAGCTIEGFIANDGKEWFGADIVCGNLDISNVSDAVSRLPYTDKAIVVITDNGKPTRHLMVSKAGVFRLIFRSRKAEAVQYQDFVFETVLPAIHDKGGFISPTATDDQLAELERELGYLRADNARLENRVEDQHAMIMYLKYPNGAPGAFLENSLPEGDRE